MHPYFTILGRDFSAYSLMLTLGIGAGFLVLFWRCKQTRSEMTDPFLVGCIALAGAIIGAVLIRPITKVPELIIHWEQAMETPTGELLSWLFGELVFYGGLIGGVLAALWYCRKFKVRFLPIADLFAAAIPVGHAFGRIGCFLGGCCYGMEVGHDHPFCVIYPARTDGLSGVAAPPGVPLLAVPLIESAGNLVIAAIIILFQRFKPRTGQSIALYGLLYGTQRFVLEFFRGDVVRGVYNGLSTSQYISLGIFVLSAALFFLPIWKEKRAGKQPED